MANKRKTREQKILAEKRHNFAHTFTSQIPLTVKIPMQISPTTLAKSTVRVAALNEYPYLIKDISKTALLTLGIFAFQIILFILLKNHALVVPGISY
jgi:hypothetical protein